MTDNLLPDPFALVAEALGCHRDTLSYDSGLNRHPDWDSFGHLNVVLALEKEYGLTISDQTITQYADMHTIIDYYEKVRSQ